jgi:O-antigen ligase
MRTTRELRNLKSEPILMLVLALLGVALGILPSLLSPVLTVGLLLILSLVIVSLFLWPLGATSLLLLATVVNRYDYELVGRTIKAEHVVVVALCALLLSRKLLEGESRFYFSWPTLFALGWLGINFLSSYRSPAPSVTGTNDLIRLTLMLGIFFILPNLIRSEAHLRYIFGFFLTLGVAESIFGILALAVYYVTGINLGVGYPASYPGPAPVGTLNAANIFGSYAMAVCLMFLVLLLVPTTESPFPRKWMRAGFFISLAALALSLTRGAWLGFAATATLFLIMRRGFDRYWLKRTLLVGTIVSAALVTVVAVVYLLPGDIALINRVASLGRLGTERTVVGRVAKYELAISTWRESPLLGWGTGGMARAFGREAKVLTWVGNLELHLLVDTGVVGLLLFALFVGTLVLGAVSALRKARGTPLRALLLSLSAGFAGLLLAYQSTEGTWLGLFWAHAGLLAAATHVVTREFRGTSRRRWMPR